MKLVKLFEQFINEASKPKVIDVLYIERTGKLYNIKVDGNKKSIDDIQKVFGIEIPSKYDENKLDNVTDQFKKKGIEFTYDDSMDVS